MENEQKCSTNFSNASFYFGSANDDWVLGKCIWATRNKIYWREKRPKFLKRLMHKKTVTFLLSCLTMLILYHPISKVFEKIIFDKMHTFPQTEQLLNRNESGFSSSD